ncbi:MAG: hypothetical protein PWQ41_1458 [Bacillota bacterium]|nr:hypothetical protein [Bacillota bacterium]MDK2960351.1 hypothetical protein [Bacillota bacterium]
MESDEFKRFSPTEKLYYWFLVSEFNARGKFYRDDLTIAVTLGCSEDKVRQARRKVEKLGWILDEPGFKLPGKAKGVATRYIWVSWANVEEEGGEAGFWAAMHRYTFEAMLAKVREKTFLPPDVVTYVYLWYLWYKNTDKGRKESFFVTKAQLRELTNLADAPERVKRLYDNYTFRGGAHLFECAYGYQKLTFSKWGFCADPSEDEGNRQLDEKRRRLIEQLAQEAKAKKAAKEKAKRAGSGRQKGKVVRLAGPGR